MRSHHCILPVDWLDREQWHKNAVHFSDCIVNYAGNNTLAPSQTGGSAVETTTPAPIVCSHVNATNSNATVYIPPSSDEGMNGTADYFIFRDVTYRSGDIETLSNIPTPVSSAALLTLAA